MSLAEARRLPEPGDLMKISDVARRAGCSNRTVERRILDGTLDEVIVPPRGRRVTRESVERWLGR
jgi:excisionase family DNA binding protein